MTGHTPGPWVTDAPEPESGLAMVEGTLILANNAPEGEKCVAECHSPTRMDADAALIAAAPDLLEALRKMDRTFRVLLSRQDHFPSADQEDTLDVARDAIAKAEGRDT